MRLILDHSIHYMKQMLLVLLSGVTLTSFSQTYYIVRHAEKAQPSAGAVMATPDDPPLSNAGQQRAETLKDLLKSKAVGYIFTTNTLRTRSTAKPLSTAIKVKPVIYDAADQAFINKLKKIKKNALIVGHSNTIDDIANGLSSAIKVNGDIPDSQYDNLYIVKRKGKKVEFEARKYGN